MGKGKENEGVKGVEEKKAPPPVKPEISNDELFEIVDGLSIEIQSLKTEVEKLKKSKTVGIDINGDGLTDIEVENALEEVEPVTFTGFGRHMVKIGKSFFSPFFLNGEYTTAIRGLIAALDAKPGIERKADK